VTILMLNIHGRREVRQQPRKAMSLPTCGNGTGTRYFRPTIKSNKITLRGFICYRRASVVQPVDLMGGEGWSRPWHCPATGSKCTERGYQCIWPRCRCWCPLLGTATPGYRRQLPSLPGRLRVGRHNDIAEVTQMRTGLCAPVRYATSPVSTS